MAPITDDGNANAFPGKVGIVVIGRNEGRRLEACLASAQASAGTALAIVYVDSGSTDSSVAVARARGVEVITLDPSRPFTAARARNEGFRRLRELASDVTYVQFVDGDCELAAAWIAEASRFLREDETVAAVAGRLRERHPQASIYNTLSDFEWDRPVGESKWVGGIAMMRCGALEQAGQFRDDLMAGEEPELCVRLRAAGWRVWTLGSEMALHDAAMTRFGQWWQRAVRTGYAYAEGAHLHGRPPERHWVREARRSLAWGLGLPALTVILTALAGWPGLLVLSVYPLQFVRLALRGDRRRSRTQNWWQAWFLVLGKFPESLGHLKFVCDRSLGRAARAIEYK